MSRHVSVTVVVVIEVVVQTTYLSHLSVSVCGPGSSVGIATDYGLDGPGIERAAYIKKNPVGVRFFAHVQTGPGAHPASCTMGTGSFPGVKRPGRGGDHLPPSSAEVENE
jgi:hypothetical protein